VLSRAVRSLRRNRPSGLPDGWLPLPDRASYDPPTPAGSPVERSALPVRLLAGATVGAVVMTLAVPAVQALAGVPVAIGSTTVAGSGLPTCAPGQQSTTVSGSGTPAPLGNLQGLPDDLASGGVFAGVALDGEQVRMAATVIAVGKQMGITKRGVEIGVAVATEQSSLRPDAVNNEWLGLFQQNPVTYTQYRRTDPGGAAWMFFDQLIKQVPGYDTDPRSNDEIGDVVQKTTTGWRFAEYNDMAVALADRLMDAVSIQQDDVTCTPAPAEQATTGSAFDPGNIISDAVFYNTSAMTVDQIRTFLLSEGEGCTGAYCLKNLRVGTTSQPADPYCQAYQGGVNEDAATVIAKVSAACGINPQVMLVTLQKESALLSRTDPTAATYNAAWGWHCPDTGPGGTANCDPAYAGFFNQAYGMAKQWSRYRVNPEKYNYRAGQTVTILWNVVESGCGGAPVTIKNTATASLYNYTPYQPNPASLAAYPGVGDACSSYGNRNFFFLFRKYFGSTGGGASTTTVNPAVLATGTTVKVPNNQYVSAALSGQTITAPTPQVAAGLAAGFSALGLPYVWGGGGSGAGPNNGCARGGGAYNSCGSEIGFDCSGLTAYVLGMAGYQTPGDSGSQRAAGVSVSWSQALPGDIVGFPGHVAIYLGTFGGLPYILEASWVGTPVHIVPLTRTDMDDRVHRYWTGTPVRSPGVADFGSIVRTYSYASPSYTPSFGSVISGWSGAGWSGYTPNIPRIRPVPYPAPAPVVTLPVPGPGTGAPATQTVEQPPAAPTPEPVPVVPDQPTATSTPTSTPTSPPTSTAESEQAPPAGPPVEPTPTPTPTSPTPPPTATSPTPTATSPTPTRSSTGPTPTLATTTTSMPSNTPVSGSPTPTSGATSATPTSPSPTTTAATDVTSTTSASPTTPADAPPPPDTTTTTTSSATGTTTTGTTTTETTPTETTSTETTPTETTTTDPAAAPDGTVPATVESTSASEAGMAAGGRAPAGPVRTVDLSATGPRSRAVDGHGGVAAPDADEPDEG